MHIAFYVGHGPFWHQLVFYLSSFGIVLLALIAWVVLYAPDVPVQAGQALGSFLSAFASGAVRGPLR